MATRAWRAVPGFARTEISLKFEQTPSRQIMSFFTGPVKLLWRYRTLLLQTTLNDIRARYAGSLLGLVWLGLYPLLLLVVVAGLGKLTGWVLLLPLVWGCQLLFTMGLIWILSSLNVYLRDIQNMVSVVILILMLGECVDADTQNIGSPRITLVTPQAYPHSPSYLYYASDHSTNASG